MRKIRKKSFLKKSSNFCICEEKIIILCYKNFKMENTRRGLKTHIPFLKFYKLFLILLNTHYFIMENTFNNSVNLNPNQKLTDANDFVFHNNQEFVNFQKQFVNVAMASGHRLF